MNMIVVPRSKLVIKNRPGVIYPVVDTAKIHDLLLPTILFAHQFVDLVVQVADLKVRYGAYKIYQEKQKKLRFRKLDKNKCYG